MWTARELQEIFKAWGGSGNLTKPIDEFPASTRNALQGASELLPGEEPAIAYFRDPNEWTLLTTRRLLWSVRGVRDQIAYEQLRDANLNVHYSVVPGTGMRSLAQLELVTKDGGRRTPPNEGGSAFVPLWNLLTLLASYRWDQVETWSDLAVSAA